MSAKTSQWVGSNLSLISKAQIRYEGILHDIDEKDSTLTLKSVSLMGTEDRQCDTPILKSNLRYEYIKFKGSDIKDISVAQIPPVQPQYQISDPAVIQNSAPTISSTPVHVPRHVFPQMPPPLQPSLPPQSQQYLPIFPAATPPQTSHGIIGGSIKRDQPGGAHQPGIRHSPTMEQGNNADGQMSHFASSTTYQSSVPHQPYLQHNVPAHVQKQAMNARPSYSQEAEDRKDGYKSPHTVQRDAMTSPHRRHVDDGAEEGQHGCGRGGGRGQPERRGSRNQYYRGAFRGQPQRGGNRGFSRGGRRQDNAELKKEFDFVTANEKFNKDELANEFKKLGVTGDDNSESDIYNEEREEEKEVSEEDLSTYYNKEKSFFDNISCEALSKDKVGYKRPTWQAEKQLNVQTFGYTAFQRRGANWNNNRRGYDNNRGRYPRSGYRGSYPRRGNSNYYNQNRGAPASTGATNYWKDGDQARQ